MRITPYDAFIIRYWEELGFGKMAGNALRRILGRIYSEKSDSSATLTYEIRTENGDFKSLAEILNELSNSKIIRGEE